MNFYAINIAKKDLADTVIEVGILKRLIFSSVPEDSMTNDKSIYQKLAAIVFAIRSTKRFSYTEVIILGENNNVILPRSLENSFLNEQIISEAKTSLNNAEENRIIEFRAGRSKYIAAYHSLTSAENSLKLVFISTVNFTKGIIATINLILLSIMLIAVLISFAIILAISNSIAKPITNLTKYAKRMGDGEFMKLPEDRSSAEIFQLTQSMNEMSQRLKDYANAQKSFLQNASHELRTPLMSIQGYAEGIVNGVFTDTSKTAQIICDESKRLNALVEELLILSRIENQTYKGSFVCLNLSDMVKEYLQRIEGYALKEGKRICLNTTSSEVFSKVDDTLLAQAVINIISNCIKYSKSEVTVDIFIENRYSVIKICDDGEGILEADLPHIFDRFYKGKKGNFGLGLSIAKAAVESMGGMITAYNDGGAVFEIRFPQCNIL